MPLRLFKPKIAPQNVAPWGLKIARRGLLLLLLALMVCRPERALGWGGGSARRDRVHEVEQMEREWRSAELAGDAAAMDRILAEDYVSVTMQGNVNTKAQQLRRMRDRLLVLERLDLSDVKIRLLGEVAIVTGRARIRGRSAGLPLDGSYRYTQVLHLAPSGVWTITNFEARRTDRVMPLLALKTTAHAS